MRVLGLHERSGGLRVLMPAHPGAALRTQSKRRLNEGFTVFLERKILGRLYGEQVGFGCAGFGAALVVLVRGHGVLHWSSPGKQVGCMPRVLDDLHASSAALPRGAACMQFGHAQGQWAGWACQALLLSCLNLLHCFLSYQMYSFQASLGWLDLQDAVKKEFGGEMHKYTALVPDLSGGC